MSCPHRDTCNFHKNNPSVSCDISSQDASVCIIVRQTRTTNQHHRINSVIGKGVKADPVEVDAKRHRLFHSLFYAWDAKRIADDLNRFWINSSLSMLVIPKQHLEKMRAYLKELNRESQR